MPRFKRLVCYFGLPICQPPYPHTFLGRLKFTFDSIFWLLFFWFSEILTFPSFSSVFSVAWGTRSHPYVFILQLEARRQASEGGWMGGKEQRLDHFFLSTNEWMQPETKTTITTASKILSSMPGKFSFIFSFCLDSNHMAFVFVFIWAILNLLLISLNTQHNTVLAAHV